MALKVNFPCFEITSDQLLSLSQMKELDLYVVENYSLPIELMMENAGMHLANLCAMVCKGPCKVLIGVGKGNNGGGGLVAARRLLAWGYEVWLDIPDGGLRELPLIQLERARRFGAQEGWHVSPDIFIDAYLGFSQKLPLNDSMVEIVKKVNMLDCCKVSLDIPTGLSEDSGFHKEGIAADYVLMLAAPKKMMMNSPGLTQWFLADLGIPKQVYEELNLPFKIDFSKSSIQKIIIK